jgi:hypothetical protein
MPENTPQLSLAKRLVVALLIFSFTFCAAYFIWVTYRSVRLYAQIKSAGRGWTAPINTRDPILGYRPLLNVSSIEMFPCGGRVPVYQDQEGFRAPAAGVQSSSGKRPFVLALGCSFTFATGCAAEEAFPFLVARGLNGTALNAGVEGYGLAQMLLRARELIPKHKPEYVLIEYAPWIVERSTGYASAPEVYGRTPRPYFAVGQNGRCIVAPPAFATNYFDLDMSAYVEGKTRPIEFASFIFSVGLPLWSYSDLQLAVFSGKRILGLLPSPAADSGALINAAYSELGDLCRETGSRMVIVVLGSGGVRPEDMPREHIKAFRALTSATLVDAYGALYAHLDPPTPEAYERIYEIWGCSPKRLIDRHPNPHAHKVIAESILKNLR